MVLGAREHQGTAVAVARVELLEPAHDGLARRARKNSRGADEAMFIEPLVEFAQANQTPAERKLELFHSKWGGSVDPVFREYAY